MKLPWHAVASLVLAISCAVALGVQPAAAQGTSLFDSISCGQQEIVGKGHIRCVGNVELEKGDISFFADEAELFEETHLLTAKGHVVFRQGRNQIAAERAEFNVETRIGIFYNALGSASLSEKPKSGVFGVQEPDVYFRGEIIEKIGPDRYRITNGGFTTCVQPEPRWQLTSGSVVLRLDHYALARNTVLRVKGVPMFYLPFLYYPVKKDDRATGLLMPSYGSSNLQGFKLSNAFFWAISRSQDATFMHDWFTKTGHGFGGEYRYVRAPGSEGFARVYLLNEHEYSFTDRQGLETLSPARRSYEIRGNLAQVIGKGFRAAARADYFSDVSVQQAYQTNLYDSSSRQRSFMGTVSGSAAGYAISGTVDRREYFTGSRSSFEEYLLGTSNWTSVGAMPRISVNRGERPLAGGLPVYFSLGTEFVNMQRQSRKGNQEAVKGGLSRLHMNPTIRVPFTRWPFLTFNSSVSFPQTFYSKSLDEDHSLVDERLWRRYADMRVNVVGPVLNRVFDTPGNGYAEKFKHTIEPGFSIQRITAIDNAERILQLETVDYVVGSVTGLNYGLTSRLYAKRPTGLAPARGVPGAAAQSRAREIISATISQTYYTDAAAARFDRSYATSWLAPPQKFTPVRVAVRATPADGVNATFNAEIDSKYKAVRTLGATGGIARGDWLQVSAGWSQMRYIEELQGFNDKRYLRNVLNGSTSLRLSEGRYGASFWFTYDLANRPVEAPQEPETNRPRLPGMLPLGIAGGRTLIVPREWDRRAGFIDTRFIAYYNIQCCGFAVEYQSVNYGSLYPKNTRFNFSFTLAGLGTFSDFFGTFGGQQGRRY